LNQLSAVGDDVLTGGAGNDLMFGDAINTDALAIAEGLTTAPGAGWLVFAELEANHGWTRADTITYIQSHMEQMAAETINNQGQGRLGGNDTLTGGDGNDILFGQEGDDVLNGGIGNDIISGGSGDNMVTGGTGSDTFLFLQGGGHDTIADYSNAESDRLDISDLLTGSAYTPGVSSVDDFVRIDHVTGQVFVDNTGTGTFGADNVVATLNGIGAVDTINVILSDSEGLRSIHTV
jgi:Ca2+-binding RTX toxin-like protein